MNWNAGIDYIQDGGWYRPKPSSAVFSLTVGGSNTLTASSATIDYTTLGYASGATRIIELNSWIDNSPSVTISGSTIGGSALVPVAGAYVTQAPFSAASDIWQSSAGLSGSSGDVQVTWTGTPNPFGTESSVGLYSLVTTTPTRHDAQNNQNFATSGGVTIDIPAGGGGLVALTLTSAVTVTPTGWTIDNTLTPSGSINVFGRTATTGSTSSISFTLSTATSFALSVASWSP